MPDLLSEEADVWAEISRRGGVVFDGLTVVRGPTARDVGAALIAMGTDHVIADETRLGDPRTRTEIPDVVDAAILLHAWATPGDVDRAARAAVAWVKRGGVVVLADLAVDRLRTVRYDRYPSSLLYSAFPDVCRAVAARTATAPALGAAGVRAGLDHARLIDVDRPLGVFDTSAEHRAAIGFGMWRGLDLLDTDTINALIGVVGRAPIHRWPHVEREPWNVLVGRSRR